MRALNSIPSLKKEINALKRRGKTIGFVPTMGALHEGHLSLIRKSRRENDSTILSIYVNPIQFNDRRDFRTYPRSIKKDKKLAKEENVDIIFYPSEKTMYPNGYLTYVEVKQLTETLCGNSRPGHFTGVTTVVAKLLHLVEPDRLYLGQKDAQQALIIKKMVEDLNFSVAVEICPTVRENDGLALSSRNKLLTPQERREAVYLYESLREARLAVRHNRRNAADIKKGIIKVIRQNTSGQIDYVECVTADSLKRVSVLKGKCLLALAVKFSKARLIDNIIINVP